MISGSNLLGSNCIDALNKKDIYVVAAPKACVICIGKRIQDHRTGDRKTLKHPKEP